MGTQSVRIFRPTITDHRGVRRAADGWMEALPDFDKDTRFKTREHFKAQCALNFWITARIIVLLPLVIVVYVALIPNIQTLYAIERFLLYILASVGLFAVYLFTLRRWIPVRRRFVLVALHGERCPACGQCIAELPTEKDGCTLCPECGGAWRLHETAEGAPA